MSRRDRRISDVYQMRNEPGALRFTPVTEKMFREFSIQRNKRWIRSGALTMLVLFFGILFVSVWISPQGIPPILRSWPLWLAAVVVVPMLVFLSRQSAASVLRRMALVAASGVIVFALLIAEFMSQGAVERMSYAYGFMIAYVTSIYTLLHLPLKWSAAAGLASSAIFLFTAVRFGWYKPTNLAQVSMYFAATNVFGAAVNFLVERQDRLFFALMLNAADATERTERLLRSILPRHVAERIKQRQAMIAERHPFVTVMFARVRGIDQLMNQLAPEKIVALLSEIYRQFDAIVASDGLVKIKTVGDTYLAVAGLGDEGASVALHGGAATAALSMEKIAADVGKANGVLLSLGVGLNTGPLVAGAIGRHKLFYDIWGDTVNVASRMESTGKGGVIQVTEATVGLLMRDFQFSESYPVEAKGKGRIMARRLTGRKLHWQTMRNLPKVSA